MVCLGVADSTSITFSILPLASTIYDRSAETGVERFDSLCKMILEQTVESFLYFLLFLVSPFPTHPAATLFFLKMMLLLDTSISAPAERFVTCGSALVVVLC